MFSALRQGSLVYILDKTTKTKYKVGEVVNATEPKADYGNLGAFSMNTPKYIDINVKVDGEVIPFNKIPSDCSVITYNNGNTVVSETKEYIANEVESILRNRQQIVNNIEFYKEDATACENILRELSPQFAKDKELEGRITKVEDNITTVNDKMDKVLELLTKQSKA